MKKRRENVSRVRNNKKALVSLHYVLNQFQIKHLTTTLWYVIKMSEWYFSTISHKNIVAAMSL